MIGKAVAFRDYTREQLDLQYNPRLTVPDFQKTLDRWARQNRKARQTFPGKLDVAYGKGATDRLDIYRPKTKGKHPVLIFFHGGYWRARSKNEFAFLAPRLVPSGMVLVLVDYALCPAVTMDELITQCRRSVAWVGGNISKHGGDPDRLFISGHSAGGHITAMIMSTDWKAEGLVPAPAIRGGFAISGLYDLEPFRHNFLKDDLRLTPEQVARNSPTLHVPRFKGQMILTVGGDESDEFHRQADDYAAAWLTAGNRNDLIHAGGRNHFTVLDTLGEERNVVRLGLLRQMGL